MGEAKRKREAQSPADKAGLKLTHDLVNQGKLIEGGFAALVMHHKLIDDPNLALYRDAYMAGAEHLWSSIFATLDPGLEETDGDMKRMDSVQRELDAWREVKMDAFAKAYPTKGSA